MLASESYKNTYIASTASIVACILVLPATVLHLHIVVLGAVALAWNSASYGPAPVRLPID